MGYNKIRDIRAGLEIFEKYKGISCAAEHDVFYAGQDADQPLSQKDVDTLIAHGWFISSEFCSGCEDTSSSLIHRDEDGEFSRHKATCNYWQIFT